MKDAYKALGSFGTVGLEVVLSLLLCTWGGSWLDGRFATAPWLTILGACLGLGAGSRAVFRAYHEMQAVTATEEREQGNPAPKFDPKDEPVDPPKPEPRVHDDGA